MTGLDPIISAARLGWDRHDPWGSGMALLGAVCDFYTICGYGTRTDGWPDIPAELGYRPALGLDTDSLAHDSGYREEDGSIVFEWDDPAMRDVASALGFSLIHNGETDGPDFVGSDEAWNTAAPVMLRTINILHRYLDIVAAAGRAY